MNKKLELKPGQLKLRCDPNIFEEELLCRELEETEIIGQKRAVKSLAFGFRIKRKGYNIFVTGLPGTGRNSYVYALASTFAKQSHTPDDWIYVYNYEKPEKPKAINLEAGKGKAFQKDMQFFIEKLEEEFPKVFTSKEYEEKKNNIYVEYDKLMNDAIGDLNELSAPYEFEFQMTENGLISYPLKDDHPLTQKEMGEMDDDEIAELRDRSLQLNSVVYESVKALKNLEVELRQKIKELTEKMALDHIGLHLENIYESYKGNKKIEQYLKSTSSDIIENIKNFTSNEVADQKEAYMRELFFTRYEVNLFIDNSKQENAPVIKELNPNYYNLLGKIEYVNENNYYRTDHTRIKPGSLHTANGGYIILQAKDLLVSPYAWAGLKRALVSNEIQIENIAAKGTVLAETIKPEPIPIDTKIIIIGDTRTYQTLFYYDEDFKKLFKIRADFDVDLDRSEQNMKKIATFVSGHCKQKDIMKFSRDALARLVEYSSRLASSQDKLTAHFNELVETIYEAEALADFSGAEIVTEEYIDKAIHEKNQRNNKYEEHLLEMIDKEIIMIETDGSEIGQINGLAVIDSGQYSFGRPSKITASTFAGEDGILNIEREVNQSGDIHDKGMLILQGYMGDRFAQGLPLSLTASITFEQSYSMIDGDSASSTELYSLLSSLSEIPIRQSIAVTGSVNQKGYIQPIGGVNEKIEGFYKVCKLKGLNGHEGVMIPHQNVQDLMLSDEVIDAVERGEFHIYAVTTIDEGIELLTGVEAGEKNDEGEYPEGTINYLVQKKLEYYANLRKDY
ncbi:MAG: AAA family ATPase [Tissierellales bacterium]|jgi:lon-related putative ATP-dependent protease|nr:AAA family ATPase [Tissierellales bacterium]